ncbi:hypothetical protein [Candidatus Entotheonella palauensis]|uniref:hypothetical protein n=1 Tax=Candidatus Entotheonella palauensis TaxID=93172 RepID=UPI000B7CECC0|nr:hypothetical protein [Candidatus Entotheonella palauensis]
MAQRANPGGQLGIGQILGRDELIRTIWEILDNQSVMMTAERRIGKTSIIRKMQAVPPEGWVPVLQDLEQFHSANEFATAVYGEVSAFVSKKANVLQQLRSAWDALGGTEIGGVLKLPDGDKQSWKTLLTTTVANLVANQEDKKLLFLWDEMPYMLDSICKRESVEQAIDILDVLRALRHQHNNAFRMLVTGLIGLHHVIKRLQDEQYTNRPFNDVYSVEVTPLSSSYGELLARELIEGESLACRDMDESAAVMAAEGDYFGFYIHHIARRLKMSGQDAEPEAIRSCVQEQLLDPNDPWELRHFRERLPLYYPSDETIVLTILDSIASSDEAISVKDLLQAIKQQILFDDREQLRRLLALLEQDHYLKRDMEGRYQFRFPLICRWWRLDRGL